MNPPTVETEAEEVFPSPADELTEVELLLLLLLLVNCPEEEMDPVSGFVDEPQW